MNLKSGAQGLSLTAWTMVGLVTLAILVAIPRLRVPVAIIALACGLRRLMPILWVLLRRARPVACPSRRVAVEPHHLAVVLPEATNGDFLGKRVLVLHRAATAHLDERMLADLGSSGLLD